jgi:hypothetical protein
MQEQNQYVKVTYFENMLKFKYVGTSVASQMSSFTKKLRTKYILGMLAATKFLMYFLCKGIRLK